MISLAGYNRNQYASKLFKQIFYQSRRESKDEALDLDIEYLFLNPGKDRVIVIGELTGSDLIYALLFNMKELPFGLLIKVLLPQFIERLNQQMKQEL